MYCINKHLIKYCVVSFEKEFEVFELENGSNEKRKVVDGGNVNDDVSSGIVFCRR